MDNNNKKQQNYTRPNNTKACQSTERKTSADLQLNKAWPRNTNARRREQTSTTARNSKQYTAGGAKLRTNVDKRPRPRGGGSINSNANTSDGSDNANNDFSAASTGLANVEALAPASAAYVDYELNSVYAPGSKKQNLNHLLNFHYAPRESDHIGTFNVFGRHGSGGGGGNGNIQRYNHSGASSAGKKHKYNKEQFMQANFQFVIKSCAKPKFTASPDTLIDWNLIEQINIQTTEEPQCPICLYPPIAAKLTRCGHAYCWPCILHYLALSDKSWRKCPICYEAIHTADLKSTTIVQQRQIKINDEITFHLMRRKKGSMFIEKFNTTAALEESVERYPQISTNDEAKLFSKFLIAKRSDILDIIERERRELMTDDTDAATCPEFVFIQQALDLLKERRDKMLGSDASNDNKTETDEINNEQVDHEATVIIDKQPKALNNEHMAENTYTVDQKTAQPANENDQTVERVDAEITAYDNLSIASTGSLENEYDEEKYIKNLKLDATTAAAATSATKYYYFYQSEDGQNIYLHPLNVKMLQACYGTLDRAPLIINARILQKEHHSMDEEHRRKFTCLGHLPLTCQFAVVEVDLQPPTVGEGILKLFKNDILLRRKERQRREREERKREKHINEINDRQMGKLIASTVNLNLASSHEFPTCGFEEFLVANPTDGFGAIADIASSSVGIPTPGQQQPHATYSSVAVVGESPKVELWPSMPPITTRSHNSYQELSSWGNKVMATNSSNNYNNAASKQRTTSERSNESSESFVQSPKCTSLSDVLAEAISQKKQNANGSAASGHNGVSTNNANVGNKKNKKNKKMLPLFSTGINYNGN